MSLVRHITPKVVPRADVLTFNVAFTLGMHCRMEDRTFDIHLSGYSRSLNPQSFLTVRHLRRMAQLQQRDWLLHVLVTIV